VKQLEDYTVRLVLKQPEFSTFLLAFCARKRDL